MNYLTAHPFLLVSASFGIIVIVLAAFLFDLRQRWKAVFGKRVTNDGEAIGDSLHRLLQSEKKLGALEPRVNALEDIGRIAIQKVGFLRFNPFEDTGGDQSFAVALLDREENGVVISSLYTREGVRVYAKEIRNGASKHQLSDEERSVLEEAKANH